jgi:hypothetical protein
MIRITPIVLLFACSDKTVQVVNTPPSVSITSPADGTIYDEYSAIEFYATINDSQQPPDELEVTWLSDIDGTLSNDPSDSSGNAVFFTSNLSPGNHVISLSVVDSKATSGIDYVEISIIDMEDDPSITIRHPQPDEFGAEDEESYFEVVVSDGQDDLNALLVVIESDLDGELCNNLADESGLFVCDSPITVGDHSLSFSVYDTSDNQITETMLYAVLPLSAIDNDGDGYSEDEGDCEDSDSSIYPNAEEYPNEVDDDCDGTIDEGTTSYDDDGDCYCESDPCLGSIEIMCTTLEVGDCDDTRPSVYYNATEVCDSVDNDCDAQIDEGTSCVDDDSDGYTEIDGDCDDNNPLTYPNAIEIADGQDNDCDNIIDEGTINFDDDGDCFCEASSCYGSITSNCVTVDGDDCDDGNPDINPDALEVCDGDDNNCDGDTDDDSSIDAQVWYADLDSDSYGDPSTSVLQCYQPVNHVLNGTDCNDGDTNINPSRPEICNGIDDNCIDGIDEGVTLTFYQDLDNDGFGDSAVTSMACSQPSGFVFDNSDCNDSNAGINPSAIEVCDSLDNDCDTNIDDADNSLDLNSAPYWYSDGDNDGYGNPTVSARQCTAPNNYVSNNDDCNDSTSSAAPGQTETCDGIDNDCDNSIDETNASGCTTYYLDSDGDGYGNGGNSQCLCSASGNYTVTNGNDCYDSNGDARPGQSAWYTTHRGDNNFDYDCNGSQTKRYNGSGSCGGWPSCSTYNGWNSGNPSCGNTGSWVTGCSTDWFSCDKNTSNRTQECH